jgi:DNA-binding CsgD family transcriptional regulator
MDGTATAELFENAARFEPELTERQREVLRLVADGKTNPEIAEALGMTLAGAKWHVSELLTKLGLESREAAAEYHRWRQARHRRVSRRIHGLLSGAALKFGLTAAGVAAAGIGVATILALQGADIDPGPAVPGLPFSMETKFTRDEELYTYTAINRYTYQDDRHQLVETGGPVVVRGQEHVSFGAVSAEPQPRVIRDGTNEWRVGQVYEARPLEDLDSGRQSVPLTALGPLKHDSIEAWLAALAADGAGSEFPVAYELVATESILGRRVERYERGPLSIPGAGSRTVWIDRDRLFVMKTRVTSNTPEGGAVTETEEVTRLTYGPAQPAEAFIFVPQPGWVEDRCDSAPKKVFQPP